MFGLMALLVSNAWVARMCANRSEFVLKPEVRSGPGNYYYLCSTMNVVAHWVASGSNRGRSVWRMLIGKPSPMVCT